MSVLNKLAVLAALCLAAPAVADEFKLAHFVAPTHTLTEAIINPLTEGVKASGLSIKIYPGGELGAGPAEQYVRVVQGVADIVWGLQGYTSSQFPLSMLTELPGALPENVSGADFLWNGWDAGLLEKEYPRTTPIALWTAEPAVLILKNHEVRKPSDLEGLKIRVSSTIAGQAVQILGGTPVQMPAGDVYNALQTGLVDGLISGSSSISDFRFNEVLDHVTLGIPLGNQSFYVVANSDRVDALPKAQRDALRSVSGRDLSLHAEAIWNKKGQKALNALREKGDGIVTDLTTEEVKAFEDILLPFTKAWVTKLGAEEAFATMRGGK